MAAAAAAEEEEEATRLKLLPKAADAEGSDGEERRKSEYFDPPSPGPHNPSIHPSHLQTEHSIPAVHFSRRIQAPCNRRSCPCCYFMLKCVNYSTQVGRQCKFLPACLQPGAASPCLSGVRARLARRLMLSRRFLLRGGWLVAMMMRPSAIIDPRSSSHSNCNATLKREQQPFLST